jgi:hypothetical protein
MQFGSTVSLLLAALAPSGEDPAVAAAREREQLVRTARFEVHVREVHAKGSRSDLAGVAVRTPVPAEELTVESDNVLVLGETKVRVESNHPSWGGSRFVLCRRVEVSDGRTMTTLIPDGVGPDRRPQAVVEPGVSHGVAKSTRWSPVTMAVRGLTPGVTACPLTGLQPGHVVEEIDGDRCREYAAPGSPDAQVRYWLAPDKGYVVRRVRWSGADRVKRQTDVRYREDATVGWLPSGWVTTDYAPDGRTVVTETVTVTAARLNESVPEDAFRVAFPPGTLVADSAARKEYRVGPDGTWHEVDPADLIRLAGRPPQPGPVAWWQLALFAWIGVAVTLGVLLAVWLRRRRPTPT